MYLYLYLAASATVYLYLQQAVVSVMCVYLSPLSLKNTKINNQEANNNKSLRILRTTASSKKYLENAQVSTYICMRMCVCVFRVCI